PLEVMKSTYGLTFGAACTVGVPMSFRLAEVDSPLAARPAAPRVSGVAQVSSPLRAGPAAPRISGLARVLVRYTIGFQPGLAALASATALRNVGQPAPSGAAMMASGFFASMAFTCAAGGDSSVASIVCSSTMLMPPWLASSLKASTYTCPNSLLTENRATLAPSGNCCFICVAYAFDSL